MARTRKQGGEASFEESLHRLEQIVEILEQGNVPLEESLRMYEEGMILSRRCMEKLNQAEKKLKVLSKDVPGALWVEEEEHHESNGEKQKE
jgi:exodeoxyribonuclease VII small subunit